MRLAPVITEEVTLSLEELIRKRIVEVDEEPSIGENAFVWLATLILVAAECRERMLYFRDSYSFFWQYTPLSCLQCVLETD
ncbi:unnamed protein product [Cuscuta campestris]|uniref:Uncharacterized protein n=1 Tax=Cuscuta campestris TaxID=132261 RepID=A0A484MP13_9ASTE|nr:unnamed protein product [Cuscuta campestris]